MSMQNHDFWKGRQIEFRVCLTTLGFCLAAFFKVRMCLLLPSRRAINLISESTLCIITLSASIGKCDA